MLTHRPGPILTALFAGAFVMGCAEMLVIGLLDLVSADLSVSVPAAGALVTANALGLAIGGPLLTFTTARADRRTGVILAAAAFIACTALPVLVPAYPLFLVARVVGGAVQGLFIAAALAVAASVAAPGRTGRALAVVISGFASASAFGLPLGTLLGQAAGWRGAFAAIAGVGAAVLVAVLVLVPRTPPAGAGLVAVTARAAFAPAVLGVLAVSALVFTGIQSALTYLVPYLTEISGVPAPTVALFLLAYGVATTAGSALGGRFADRDAAGTLVVGTAGVTVALVMMWLFGANPWVAAVAVLGMGAFGMGLAPSMQHRVVALAGRGADLAQSLPSSAVNIGIAGGSLLGGAAIAQGGIGAAPAAGAAVALIAIVAAVASRTLTPAPIPAPKETS